MTERRGIGFLQSVAASLLLVLVLAPSSLSMAGSQKSPATRIGCMVAVGLLHMATVTGHRWPRASFVTTAAGALVLTMSPMAHYKGRPTPMFVAPSMLCFLVALYWVTVRCPATTNRLALGIAAIGGVIVAARLEATSGWHAQLAPGPGTQAVFVVVVFAGALAAWATGRLRQQALAAHAGDLRRAAADERARIVTDMHDVVSHSLAVIITQAEGGRMIAAEPATRDVLSTISATGRSALADMRSMLGVLRPESTSQTDPPTPGAEGIERLARQAGASFEVIGEPLPVAGGVGLTAHRVAQEALTNALKHGDGWTSVQLTWSDRLVLCVTNEVTGQRSTRAGGLGLGNMRARTEAVGGVFEAGPMGQGWRVRCNLPVTER